MNIFNAVAAFFSPPSPIPVKTNICIVAILKDEDKFLDEWLAYHRLLGVDHFYLYDNDPRLPLKTLTQAHAEYVTVTEWLVEHDQARFYTGGTVQAQAYTHFLKNFSTSHDWVAFIDGDEFIVLRTHENLQEFLTEFNPFDSISFNWHVFGHNGYYEDPKDLITTALIRRMKRPSEQIKSIHKVKAIVSIENGHCCRLKTGNRWVDANKKKFNAKLYPGKTKVAHINHYQCRSFKRWMARPALGSVGSVSSEKERAWRFDQQKCLRQFVVTVARNKNEFIDEYMLKYATPIKEFLTGLKQNV